MLHRSVIIFLLLSVLFAAAHYFAVITSLYWYLWWFDVVMHFWGGILIGLGIYSLSTFSRLHFKPTLPILLLAVLALATVSWEIFEFMAGLWQPETYVADTIQDIIIGFTGGLLAHVVLRRYTIS